MTEQETLCFENLKTILKNIRTPHLLDDHPWTHALIVRQALVNSPQLAGVSPGQRLVTAMAGLFSSMQPPAPPRHGKRLDSRWGEFGLLAALYFTPFNHGTPYPSTFMEAWERMAPAILYHVYGQPAEALSEEQIEKYQLVGDEVEYGSSSTLSDWHKKGLQRLAEILVDRERFLEKSTSEPSVILNENGGQVGSSSSAGGQRLLEIRKVFMLGTLLVLVTLLILAGLKARNIYNDARTVYQDVNHLRGLAVDGIQIEDLATAGDGLSALQNDLTVLKEEVQPFLWLGPRLRWLPTYGGDLASASDLIELAESLTNASQRTLQAARPLIDHFGSESSSADPASLTGLLVQAQPGLLLAQQDLDQALAARDHIQTDRLSPRLSAIITEELDPILGLAQKGLILATALPDAVGAAESGPKTYLLLAQNEDELRSTGGYITSVGNLVLANGQVLSMDFEESGDQEDWSTPYPAAPWQLQEYMGSPVLVLRDSNWFTDFPTTALWAEYLYARTHAHSVDGVIAFDQHFLVMLLGQIGPLQVEGADEPVTDKNVVEFMRRSKAPPPDQPLPEDWYRKEFIGNIAKAILKKMTDGKAYDWRGLTRMLLRALDERHILLQLDDPALAALITERGWDNAVRPAAGDFLMVTDTNVGYNKTNAVVAVSLTYDVDLTDITDPTGTLTVMHQNKADSDVPCLPGSNGQDPDNRYYRIDNCYWNYLRVYRQEGITLLDASPHAIPADWMLLGQEVPARVDELEENIQGVRGFGTLLVVPGGQVVTTNFRFALPSAVLAGPDSSGQMTYQLKIHKQPGTLAHPITIRIHLPNRAAVRSISTDAIVQDNNLLIQTDLRTDVDLEIIFSLP